MAVLKKHLTPIGRGGITKHAGKGSKAQSMGPGQSMNTMTGGNTIDRSMQNYAKSTPMANPTPIDTGDDSGPFSGMD